MNRTQRRTKAVLILKILNVVTGILNVMSSIALLYIAMFLISFTKAYGHSWLHPFALTFVFIFIMCASKLSFDFIFIYSVVKERLTVVKLYCYLSVVLLILMTTFLMTVGTETGETNLWIILYSLNISTILLSHFYEQICGTEVETTQKV
ncbi:uncharacterized protein LOC116770843 [Danaus plexippus]|uniref:uncharacterized protein LOC116770843 n=1 Tax=Danaus plexippus TaxID=13037 RepID=UPI002AB19611|nr:uncharacterized protein LOC116770843 [Danaus plexippus]XP_032518366.2 uncharacterized protein LOC116770843 [Danaus plexippus]XP_032518367.2 uncharacterized protein LOC116770843 [Danaus plexippus]